MASQARVLDRLAFLDLACFLLRRRHLRAQRLIAPVIAVVSQRASLVLRGICDRVVGVVKDV